MKKIYFLSFFIFSLASSFAQKQINEYTIEELTNKKQEAIASKATLEIAVYSEAISIKTEINAALKVEDFEKAAVLQAKLKDLKLSVADIGKEKELQEAINKAVASEDYAKADELKKELIALNTTHHTKATGPPSEVKYTSSTSSNSIETGPPADVKYTYSSSTNSSSNSTTSRLTKSDIYGSSVVWMGLDFSLFNYVSKKKVGEEQKHLKYVGAWQKEFAKSIPEKKLAQWLGKPQFMGENYYVENLYKENLNRQWMLEFSNSISIEKIQAQIQTYKSNNKGLALVFIPGVFNETQGLLTLNVVWFDIDTRAIIDFKEVSVKAGPASMTSRWLDGLIEATKNYVDKYYKKRQ